MLNDRSIQCNVLALNLMDRNMRVVTGAKAIVLNEKGEVLLIQRQDLHSWVFPGGKIDNGETPEETAIRETEEETGIKIKITKLLAISVVDHPLRKVVSFLYLGQKIGGQEKRQKGETLEIKWVNPKEVVSYLDAWHARLFKEAILEEGGVKLIVSHDFPMRVSQLPLFFWRRTLGKKLGLVRV